MMIAEVMIRFRRLVEGRYFSPVSDDNPGIVLDVLGCKSQKR